MLLLLKPVNLVMEATLRISPIRKSCLTLMLLLFAGIAFGCGSGWKLDYWDPAAQFLEADVAASGKTYLGQKITVKGTVTRIDQSDPECAKLYLGNGVCCDFRFVRASGVGDKFDCNPGDTVYVDGMLRRCAEGDVLLEPAMLRDPTAPFEPK